MAPTRQVLPLAPASKHSRQPPNRQLQQQQQQGLSKTKSARLEGGGRGGGLGLGLLPPGLVIPTIISTRRRGPFLLIHPLSRRHRAGGQPRALGHH